MKKTGSGLQRGDIIEINTHGLARGGAAVGKTDSGFVVFVQGAAPNERVRVEIESVKKNLAFARLVEIRRRADGRVDAPCPYASECGGCCWQHVHYSIQLAEKQKIVEKALHRISPSSAIQPIVPSPDQYRYRDRISLNIEDGKPVMKKRASGESIEITDCLIAAEGLVQNIADRAKLNPKARRLSARADEPGNDDQSPLTGDFSQINPKQNRALIDWVLSQSELVGLFRLPTLSLVDLYCGNGNLSLPLIGKADQLIIPISVYGCDLGEISIQSARQQVDLRNQAQPPKSIRSLQYEICDAEKGIELSRQLITQPDLIVLDPPRDGASSKAIRALATRECRWICYVSCDPMTLARDLELLLKELKSRRKTLSFVSIQPFDFFPQTDHVEVATFAEVVTLPSIS